MSAERRSNGRSAPGQGSATAPTPSPVLCQAGCGKPVPQPKAKFCSAACRARQHDREHPRVDLSGVPEERRAALLGDLQAIVVSRVRPPARPDRHRPRHRIYLDEKTYTKLKEIAARRAAALNAEHASVGVKMSCADAVKEWVWNGET